MQITSEERRKVAAKLRALADGEFPMDECSVDSLYIAIGLGAPFSRGGIEYAAIEYLADLIDPTCKIDSVEPIRYGEFNETIGYEFNLTCGHSILRACTEEPPAFCNECGARVVSDDD